MDLRESGTNKLLLSLPPSVFTTLFVLVLFLVYRLTSRYNEQRVLSNPNSVIDS